MLSVNKKSQFSKQITLLLVENTYFIYFGVRIKQITFNIT